ncbi:hypothetical protein X737_16575 [Mesorhizobium sp. L48C026A00]|nr:hypothetical protein X737_16575 [Mesorhizobium sp. L48C026A00]
MTQVDETKLNELVGRVLGDLGGAVSVPLVRIGDSLGLYETLKRIGPLRPKNSHQRQIASPAMSANGSLRRRPPATSSTRAEVSG